MFVETSQPNHKPRRGDINANPNFVSLHAALYGFICTARNVLGTTVHKNYGLITYCHS